MRVLEENTVLRANLAALHAAGAQPRTEFVQLDIGDGIIMDAFVPT